MDFCYRHWICWSKQNGLLSFLIQNIILLEFSIRNLNFLEQGPVTHDLHINVKIMAAVQFKG